MGFRVIRSGMWALGFRVWGLGSVRPWDVRAYRALGGGGEGLEGLKQEGAYTKYVNL